MRKKNLFLTVAMLIATCLPVWAQGAGSYRRPTGSRTSVRDNRIYHWQHSDNQYIGIRMGYNSASLGLKGCNGVDHNAIDGMNVGIVYGTRLSYESPIYFETGALYSGKGSRLRKGTDHYTIRMHTLEVPLVFKYKVDTDLPEFSIQPLAGLFTSVGVGGKYKDFQERKKHSTFHKGSFQNFDLGFRLGCGLQYYAFYAEITYDLGMVNMASSDASNLTQHLNYDDFDDKIRTGNLSLTVGVNF